MIVAWAYSVPPVRLKERPPLDSLANGLGFFLLPFVMGYSLGADPAAMPLKYYLLALSVCGIHALATAADYDADLAAGHRTLPWRSGGERRRWLRSPRFRSPWRWATIRVSRCECILLVGTLAALAAAIVPRDRVISVACVTIFVGFLVAAVCHVVGW